MESTANIGFRLYSVLDKASRHKGSAACLSKWAETLEIPHGDNSRIISGILEVGLMPDRVAADFRKISGLEHDRYLHWVNVVKRPFENLIQFNINMDHFIKHFDPGTLNSVWICSDLLKNNFEFDYISPDRWKRMLKHVRAALDLLRRESQSLPYGVHRFILKHLLIIEQSIIDYQFYGIERLRDACGMVAGITAMNRDIYYEAKKTKAGRRAVKVVGMFFAVLSTVDTSINMLDRANDLLGLPDVHLEDGVDSKAVVDSE